MAYEEEEQNCQGVYQPVLQAEVPRSANAISSHVSYKVKVNEDGTLKLKARICPHGIRDKDKDGILKDSAAAQFLVIRFMLSLSALMGLRVVTIDISAAHLHSSPIRREIFVFPLKEHRGKRGTICKLLKLQYGIAEAGRQWQTTCEAWLLSSSVGFERVAGVSQFFVFRNWNGNFRMLCAKVTEDFLFSGCVDDFTWFDGIIRKQFKVSFNGAVVEQNANGDISLSME